MSSADQTLTAHPLAPLGLRTRASDAAERIVLFAALAFSVSVNLSAAQAMSLPSLAADLLVLAFVLVRRPARRVSEAPLDWALAFGASLGILLMRPGGTALVGPAAALALAGPGWLIALAALVSLNRAFGVVAANRGVQARGAYRVVRHPMYLGYLLGHTAYLLLNPTGANVAVYVAVGGCQVGRILREERLLGADPAYRAYRARVRFRVLPGLW